MKKKILFIILTAFLGLTLYAQNDTLYIMKNGTISAKYNVNTQIDSVIFYNPFKGTFTDSRDGNTYNWVKIGNQIWMAENLKYLPSVVGPTIESRTQPYYYVYDYYGTNVTEAKATYNYNTYGVLYNWAAAMAGFPASVTNPSGVQGICPSGWHLPSDAEWTQLVDFAGGESIAGGKLKATILFNFPNTGATDDYGFSVLPHGTRRGSGITALTHNVFDYINIGSSFWYCADYDAIGSWYRSLAFDHTLVFRGLYYKEDGMAVRCVKN